MGRHAALNLALTLALLLALLGPPTLPATAAAYPSAQTAAEAAYTVIDLGVPPGGYSPTASDVNTFGQVIGIASDPYRAFLWENGHAIDLGTLGGESSQAYGINDAGQVVGTSSPAVGSYGHAFVWQNGQMTALDALGNGSSQASAINNAGQIAGHSDTDEGKIRAILWHEGQMTVLPSLGGDFTWAHDINDAGQIVGGSYTTQQYPGHAYLWSDGQMIDLGTLGGDYSQAFGINAAGQVVGASNNEQGEMRAFLWQDGQMTDLGTLGGYFSEAYAINDAGQVVGVTLTEDGFPTPFVWQDGQMTDLQSLLPPNSGWDLYVAGGISNNGIIAGSGFVGGEQRPFAMFPTDPPSATCADPQIPAPQRGLQSRTFGALTVRAESFTGGANWTAAGTVWLGSHAVVQNASITNSGGTLTGSGVVSMVTATGPERVTPLFKDSFSVSADGTLTPAAANGRELRLARLGGFCVKPSRYQLGLDLARGVLTGSADLWLRVPEQPLIDKPFSFTLRSSGALSGSLLDPATFDLGLIDLEVEKALLGNDGITTKEASLILDAVVGGASVALPDGAFRLTADDGLATTIPVLLPNIKFGADGDFGIEGVRATLSFGGGSYRFTGAGTLLLPGVATDDNCEIGATLELVSTPPPIREASFSVSGGCVRIPIGTTGAFITGFGGKTTANETDLALDFTVDIVYGKEVPVLGELVSGTLGAHWDATWRVGLNGEVQIFKWDVAEASLSLGPTDGLRGSLTLKVVPVLEGTGQIHAWQDGAGYHLTGHADTTIKTSAGALINECSTVVVEFCLVVPPEDLVGPSENADFGEFRTPQGTAYGLKGYVNAFGYSPAFFVDVDGNVAYDLGGLRDYQLVDQPAQNLALAGAAPDAVYTLDVDDAPALIVGLAHDTGDLTLTLTDPNGRTIDAATVADDLFVSVVEGQTVYTVADPPPGTWKVRVGNRAGDEHYLLRAFGATPAPQITQPPVATTTTTGYTVAFAGTAGPDATYSLFYDDDNAGNDGRPIAQGVPLSQTTVTWDTRAVPAGTYYLYAMLDDPAAAPAFAYSAAPVTVSDTAAPGTPTGVGVSLTGDEATITWTPPADPDLAGFRIYYTEPGNGKTFATDLPDPAATRHTQPGLALNGDWTIAVSAYDINGNESPRSAPVTVPVVAYVAAPAPVNVSPAGGPTAGGTPVTITGLDFQPGATVTFGGVPVTSVQVLDAQTITAVAPPHAAGLVAVVVANPGGQQGTLAAGYEYADPQATHTATLTTTGNCQATLSPAGPFASDATVTAQVTFNPATTAFTGWALDGTPVGWANPLLFAIAGANHTLTATCVARPTFGDLQPDDPAHDAIVQLAARGAIRGYLNGNFGSGDGVQRAQMAALIARATPAGPGTPTNGYVTPPACVVADSWDCEDWGTAFTDPGGITPSLWRNAGTLQHYGVALGYTAQDCERKGRSFPCYGPTDPVSHAQTIAFITRAMIAKGYWQPQPDAPLSYVGVPGVLATEVRTFHHYTGGIPAAPSSAATWNGGATRGWFARALWAALDSYWGTDRIP
jgi:probable HAF family extracellular repeat protein